MDLLRYGKNVMDVNDMNLNIVYSNANNGEQILSIKNVNTSDLWSQGLSQLELSTD